MTHLPDRAWEIGSAALYILSVARTKSFMCEASPSAPCRAAANRAFAGIGGAYVMSFIDRAADLQPAGLTIEAPYLGAQRRHRLYVVPPIDIPSGLIELALLVVTACVAELLFASLVMGLL
jgi:hypothetical protein